MDDNKHRITNVDPEQKLGDCSICGPGIVLLRDRSRYRTTWRCRTAGRAAKKASWMRAGKPQVTNDKRNAVRDRLLSEQDGTCPICESTVTSPRLDHCHVTGRTRSVLCNNHNIGLGMFGDDPDMLIRASEYLLWWAAVNRA